MIGALGKLLDRNFVLAYALPAIVLLAGGLWLAQQYKAVTGVTINFNEPFKDGTLLAIIAVVVAVLLMVFNLSVYRFMEGYRYDWMLRAYRNISKSRRFGWLSLEHWSYAQLTQELARQLPDDRRKALLARKVNRYPREELLLATSFGNVIRASEDYAMQMYEFPGVEGWARMTAVMPKDFLAQVDAERATMDLWVNLWLVGVILSGEYLILLLMTGHWRAPWFAVAAPCLSLVAFRRARSAAESWGLWLRAAYDLYVPSVATRLGLAVPKTIDKQRAMWKTWWRSVRRRQLADLQVLDEFRSDKLAAPQSQAADPQEPVDDA